MNSRKFLVWSIVSLWLAVVFGSVSTLIRTLPLQQDRYEVYGGIALGLTLLVMIWQVIELENFPILKWVFGLSVTMAALTATFLCVGSTIPLVTILINFLVYGLGIVMLPKTRRWIQRWMGQKYAG